MLHFLLKWQDTFQSVITSHPTTRSMMNEYSICQGVSVVTETVEHITDNSNENALYFYSRRMCKQHSFPLQEHYRHCVPWFDGNAIGNISWSRTGKYVITTTGGSTLYPDMIQLLFITQHEVNVGNTFLLQQHAGPSYIHSDFGGLEVACWPLVTKFAGSNPADFSGRKNPQHAFLRKGSKAVCPMSHICGI